MTQSKAIEQGNSALSGAARERIIRKIKRCLALGQSSNQNEAEMAMRQAQKMMQEYRLGEADVLASEVSSTERQTGLTRMSDWQRILANTAARAFNCKFLMRHYTGGPVTFIFIGVMPAAELAAYAYDTLLAQVKKDRKDFRSKYDVTRGQCDDFCSGWVYAVNEKITQFAHDSGCAQTANALMVVTQREDAAIDAWIKESMDKVTERKSIKKEVCQEAVNLGAKDGQKANIHNAIHGAGQSSQALLTA